MARASWSGFLGFGLVNVPVALFSATEDQTIHFNQVHRGSAHRIRYKKVDEETGDEVSPDDIVNGFPLGGGEYVIVTPEELEGAAPGKSELIEVVDFVDLGDIDPIYFRQSYYLAPKGRGAERAYSLLLEAMRQTQKVGVATMVLRDKEHLVAIRPGTAVIILETMFFNEEIRDPQKELENLPAPRQATERELSVATQLIDALARDWDPTRYKNAYRDRIKELIEKKREGHAIVVGSDEPRTRSNVVDLMSALQASIDRTTGRSRGGSSSARRPTRREKRSVGADAISPLDELSKVQLLDRARQLDVAVTSRATKDELVRIVSSAQAPKKRRGRKAS